MGPAARWLEGYFAVFADGFGDGFAVDFHERVRRGFLDIAKADPERCVLIDAEGSADAVERKVRKAVAARLGTVPS